MELMLSILGVLSVIAAFVIRNQRTKKMITRMPIFVLQHETESLQVEQARAMVDNIIAKGEILVVETGNKETLFPEQLGPITKEFFSRYSVLEARKGGFRLALEDIKVSEYIYGYISIGHCEDWDVVHEPYSDNVFLLEGGELAFGIQIERFPSVYHLIISEIEYDN